MDELESLDKKEKIFFRDSCVYEIHIITKKNLSVILRETIPIEVCRVVEKNIMLFGKNLLLQ